MHHARHNPPWYSGLLLNTLITTTINELYSKESLGYPNHHASSSSVSLAILPILNSRRACQRLSMAPSSISQMGEERARAVLIIGSPSPVLVSHCPSSSSHPSLSLCRTYTPTITRNIILFSYSVCRPLRSPVILSFFSVAMAEVLGPLRQTDVLATGTAVMIGSPGIPNSYSFSF